MLNNINFKKIKDNLKLYKIKKNTIALGLGFIISSTLTSCSNNTDYINVEAIPISAIEIEEDIKQKDFNEYINYFSTYEVHYNFEKYLLKEKEINDILSSYDESKCKYEYDIDIAKLIEKINSNSKKYIKQNKQYISAFMNDMSLKETDEELFFDQFNFEIYLEYTLMQLFEKATNDINEDIHKMQELKIVFGNTHEIYEDDPKDYYVLGYYDNDRNIIVLSRENLKIAAEIRETTFEYVLYDTLIHEINHMRQYKCDCRKGMEVISYNNHITTLIESSAESEIYNLGKNFSFLKKDSHEYSYYDERVYENLLFLLSIYNEDVTIEDYYNAIFDSNINALLEFYNLNTYVDKQNFFNILYMIDGINCRNNLIYECYSKKEIENLVLKELKKDIGYGYKTEIFKKCLKDAVKYTINNPDFELEDNLLVLNIIKNKIVNDSYYLKEEKGELGITEHVRIYDEEFVIQILELENKYIEFLENYYGIDKALILEKEDNLEPYIKNVVSEVNNQCAGDLTYYSKTVDILNRFPILKTIIYSETYNMYEYSDFEEEIKTMNLKLN